MTDRPIIFSAPMVRALLREAAAPGTGKTQTRRIWKLPTKGIYERPDMGGWEATTFGGAGIFTLGRDGSRIPTDETVGIWHRTTGACLVARYQVGDRLWVREAWELIGDGAGYRILVRYAADDTERWFDFENQLRVDGRKRPSIHMPRKTSRLTLLVTDVRVQRLQDISEDDARAEGAEGMPTWGSHRSGFDAIWLDIHGVESWNANPWVVAVSFRPVLANIDAPELAGAA